MSLKNAIKNAIAGLGLVVLATAPVHADSHCDAVMTTVEVALAVRQTQTDACEDGLNKARELLEVARQKALECGCNAAADNLAANIEISKSTDYSCFNKSQGLGTLRGGIADIIQCSCHSC